MKTKFEFNNGQITFSFFKSYLGKDNVLSGHDNGLQIQLYFPKFKLKNSKEIRNHKELFISFPTCVRIVSENNYFGLGWEILGFGFAFDYQNIK